ncbi:MAG: hypothetical protein KDK28_19855 [Maritimibacter sp.]|nr:hypothetical protein [Maritimibacter sp.]
MPSARPALRPVARLAASAAVLVAVAWPGQAEQFTTAEEVKPMLDFTRADWVSLREFNGDDQLLFTHILAWRCGIDRISYAVNGGDRERLAVEPCYEGETRPNDFKDNSILPYVTFPAGSVTAVTVWLNYDDGSTDKEDYKRKAILSR